MGPKLSFSSINYEKSKFGTSDFSHELTAAQWRKFDSKGYFGKNLILGLIGRKEHKMSFLSFNAYQFVEFFLNSSINLQQHES